jgi:hypothetical protein
MPIEEIHTNSLDEFWEKLSPIGEFMSKMGRVLLRGQGDSAWPLTSSVLRDEIINKYSNGLRSHSQTDHIIFFEYFALIDFVSYCDQMGYIIPRDTVEFRDVIDFDKFTNRYGINAVGWPSKEFYPILALAQHHGIPTRLLDWTRNSFVAAYFAASQALSLPKLSDSLCVWVIDSKKLHLLDGRIEIVTLPGSISHNLAAQKGEFIVHKEANGINRNTPFDPSGYKYAVNNIIQDSKDFIAYKVTLPARLAGELMFRCNKFDINAATLFPSFDGAAKAALEFKMAKKQSGHL